MADLGNFTKTRVESFSDAVFAIVVTLLVFEVKFPHIENAGNQAVWNGIVSTFPKLISWIISFLTVCVFWMNHHRLFDMFRRIDGGLFWANNIVLMFISLIPFPTLVIGDYPYSSVATFFYGICLATASTAIIILRLYVRGHKDLLRPEISLKAFNQGTWLSVIYGVLFYLLGAGAGWFSTYLAFGIYFFIAVYFIFPGAMRTK